MGVVIVKEKVTEKDLVVAREEYGDFIKVTIDLESKTAAIGGEWHADGEKILIQNGSKQKNIWGGGINLKTKRITTSALINLRISQGNDSQEILDPVNKQEFSQIVNSLFRKYI